MGGTLYTVAMGLDLKNCLVVGISSRALFDLERENEIFENEGLEAYIRFQLEHEDEVLNPGTGFHLIRALLELNKQVEQRRLIEVIVISHNSPDTGLRVFNSISHHGLDVTRAAFSGGEGIAPYLSAFNVDLFLSRTVSDVQAAVDAGFPAATIYDPPDRFDDRSGQIRIAFDADAVIFSEEAEAVYRREGLEAFARHEQDLAQEPLSEGPFAKLLKTLSYLQNDLPGECSPVRIAIVTARNSPAHERVIRTLRNWGVRVDSAFFLGGLSKHEVLQAFRAHIFFDDQEQNLTETSKLVPAARVPYKSNSCLSADHGKDSDASTAS